MNENDLTKDAPAAVEGTILFVDDEKVNQIVGETVLRRLGYNAVIASNGMEAVEKFKTLKNVIDLIIMDINMPVMDGEEAVREIRSIDPDVRFIVSSGIFTKSQTRELELMGISYFLIKPYRADAVSTAIESVLHED